jgi:crotonobetainyl-CoA:carnitine CoA-transferase CaiB-like acyl-CoA transferase
MQPLTGIKILDLSRLLPGPFASLVLADLGASVDRVEDTSGGDSLRGVPPFAHGDQPTSSIFLALNRNKRSLAIDLKNPDGKLVFRKVALQYDVVIDQFRPGVLKRLGLPYETLQHDNPRLIVCALTGYGQNGPHCQRAGHDLNFLARAGVLGMQGPASGPPTVPGFQLADVGAGLFAALGIMGALMTRAQTGQGSVVDIAMSEAAMPFAMFGYGQLFGGQLLSPGAEPLTGGIGPYGTYATKDGKAMALAAIEPKFWLAFCEGTGIHADMSDGIPGPHQATLKAKLKEIFATRTQTEWVQFASTRECCLEPVLTPEQARADAHLEARGMFFDIDSPWGKIGQMRTPISPPLPRAHTPPPKHGEHTNEILREAGYSSDDIAKFRASGAVQ